MNGARYALATVALARLRSAAATAVVSGAAALGEVGADGGMGGGSPSGASGGATLDDASASGGVSSVMHTVVTPPLSMNPGLGGLWAGVNGLAIAVLSDDANLSRIAGATSRNQAGDGTVTLADAVPGSVGQFVVVVVRFADGSLGIERCQLS